MIQKGLLSAFLWCAVFVAIGALFFLHFSTQRTYAYVDAQRLVNGYKGMQDARKEYKMKVMSWRSNLDTLRSEMEQRLMDYESKKDKVPARELRAMEEVIDTKHEQYLNFEKAITEKIRTADQDLTSEVLAKVNDYIRRYGKRKGYDIIMAATQYGNIVYAEDHIDITQEILDGLNSEYEK